MVIVIVMLPLSVVVGAVGVFCQVASRPYTIPEAIDRFMWRAVYRHRAALVAV